MSDRMPIDTVRMYVFAQFPFITIFLYVLEIIIDYKAESKMNKRDFSKESNLEILIKYTVGFKNK